MQFIAISNTIACTIFRIKAKDGTIALARSMEFGVNLGYDLIMVPRNKPFVSPSPLSKMGLKWASKSGYAVMAKTGKL